MKLPRCKVFLSGLHTHVFISWIDSITNIELPEPLFVMAWCNYRIIKVNYLQTIIKWYLLNYKIEVYMSYPGQVGFCDLELLPFKFPWGFFCLIFFMNLSGTSCWTYNFFNREPLLLPIFLMHLHTLKSELMQLFFPLNWHQFCCVLRREKAQFFMLNCCFFWIDKGKLQHTEKLQEMNRTIRHIFVVSTPNSHLLDVCVVLLFLLSSNWCILV